MLEQPPANSRDLREMWVVIGAVHFSTRFVDPETARPVAINEEPYWFLPVYESEEAARRDFPDVAIQRVTIYTIGGSDASKG
jgi:hypothetical protein